MTSQISWEILPVKFICGNLEGQMRILDNYHKILYITVFCEGRNKIVYLFLTNKTEDDTNICHYRNAIQAYERLHTVQD